MEIHDLMCAHKREGLGEALMYGETRTVTRAEVRRGQGRRFSPGLPAACCIRKRNRSRPCSRVRCRPPFHWPLSSSLPLAHVRRRQARHATYGAIEAVAGRLVPADPLIAHQDLNNAGEVAGCVVYVKVAALDVFVYQIYTAYTCMYASTQ
jgi:hypothetical protein